MLKKEMIKWFELNFNEYTVCMKNTTHTCDNGKLNPYHMEGSIWNHTLMTIECLESDHPDLILACMLHDIGKIHTRAVSGDRVSFKGHEKLSVILGVDILKKAKEKFINIDIVKILKMIAWHGNLWLRNSQGFEDKLKEIDLKYGNDIDFYVNFTTFVHSDAVGRKVHLKESEDFIKEQIAFLREYVPKNEFNSNECLYPELVIIVAMDSVYKREFMSSNKMNEFKEYDKFLIENIQDNKDSIAFIKNKAKLKRDQSSLNSRVMESISKNKNIIIDFNCLTRKQRKSKLSLFQGLNYKKRAIVIMDNTENLKEESWLSDMGVVLELPEFDEFNVIEYYIS